MLITIWREQNVQEQVDNVTRSKAKLTRKYSCHKSKGFQFRLQTVQEKVKNLTAKYRKGRIDYRVI